MSTAAKIPVFDPQGVLRDIPEEQIAAAVKAGGMPAVKFQAPDNKIRFVPANRTQEAYASGGKLLPFQQQDVKHPGFWATLYDDVSSMPARAYHAVTEYDPMTDPDLSDSDKMQIADQQSAAAQAKNDQRTKQHGTAYSVGASANEMLGVNVEGEEKSGAEGDPGGVLGHAAAIPTAMAITEGAGAAASKAAPFVRPVVKAALSKVPEAVGASAGAYLGHATGLPEGGLIGAVAGRQFVARLVDAFSKSPEKFAGELDATGENKPYAGGMDEWQPKPARELDATGENKPFAGGMDEAIPAKTAPAATPATAPGQAGSMAESVAIPQRYSPPVEPAAATTDPLLQRLRNIASQISEEDAKPGKIPRRVKASTAPRIPAADEDLVGILQQSLKQVQQKAANQ